MTSFEIAVPDESITLLKDKLKLSRLPDEIDGAGWDYGAPLADIRRLSARWLDGYDWRKHEKALNNELPQFTRDIAIEGHGTLNVHYVYKQSEAKNAIPLLFVHGWPGSFIEVRRILPLLTAVKESAPSFHVVAYSLPGFGFSQGAKTKGFALKQYAEVGHKLMLALGYNEYVAQGGDWGSGIVSLLRVLYGPTHVKAVHSNTPFVFTPPPGVDPSSYTPGDLKFLERIKEWQQKGMGYIKQQATQPQTIGYSLADSPVGLLAWIYEKLVRWTDEYPWDDDEILTWISIYWFSRSGPAASVRIYYESFGGSGDLATPPLPESKVPLGYSVFEQEQSTVPKSWIDAQNPAFHERHKRGGHFPALEKPTELVGDIRKMFSKGFPTYGVVPGKDGYV
ncbi:hypothetical protein V5O48_011063 [Marasmius crinis-equi]|uniref:Epoxide hydrolase N-terminal domain-containing protein n=1 Tax=Marasmius crinis-equi TaxID=585013 RepID=A0ABR3F745_9AGAR